MTADPIDATARLFAAFIARHDPRLDAEALHAVALLAALEARGHSCLQLGAAPDGIDGLDGVTWPAPGVRDRLAASRCVACIDPAAGAPEVPQSRDAVPPLVLAGDRLYLRRYWDFERRIASRVHARLAQRFELDVAAARASLDALFPPSAAAADGAIDWQKVACAAALGSGLGIVTGGPGTGKTFTVARLLLLHDALHRARHGVGARVALAAPTGKAAARLTQSIGDALHQLAPQSLPLAAGLAPAQTLHGLLGASAQTRRMRHDAARPLDVDLLVVDEASMVHLEMMAALLDALLPQARLVLLGDKDQLASVEAGAVLGDLCADAERGRYRADTAARWQALSGQTLPQALRDDSGPELAQVVVMLRHSRRFAGALGELAAAVNRGDADTAQQLLDSADTLAWHDGAQAAAQLATALDAPSYATYLRLVREGPRAGEGAEDWAARVLAAFDRFRLLCAVHDGPWGDVEVNRAVEAALAARGWITPRQPWYVGQPLIATRNDRDLGLSNGDLGIVLPDPGRPGALRAYFGVAGAVRGIAAARLHAVQTAYALTVHKSQGSEFEHAALVLPAQPRGLSRELIYTAVTRARQRVSLIGAQRAVFDAAVRRRVRRSSGLPALLRGPR